MLHNAEIARFETLRGVVPLPIVFKLEMIVHFGVSFLVFPEEQF